MARTAAEIEALVEAVRSAAIDGDDFDHAAHLTVAAWYVARMDLDAAHAALREVLQRLLATLGVRTTATTGYHDTLTRAWLQLVGAALAAQDPALGWPERVEAVCQTFADKALILRYYSRDRMLSPEARAGWLEPDLAPLDVPPDALA